MWFINYNNMLFTKINCTLQYSMYALSLRSTDNTVIIFYNKTTGHLNFCYLYNIVLLIHTYEERIFLSRLSIEQYNFVMYIIRICAKRYMRCSVLYIIYIRFYDVAVFGHYNTYQICYRKYTIRMSLL